MFLTSWFWCWDWRDSRHRIPKFSGNPKISDWTKMCFPDYFFIKKMNFEKLLKGTRSGRLSPPNSVHAHPQLKNTLSPPGHKLISIEILTYPLDLNGKSIESKLISEWNSDQAGWRAGWLFLCMTSPSSLIGGDFYLLGGWFIRPLHSW